jgi:hypothetical protein
MYYENCCIVSFIIFPRSLFFIIIFFSSSNVLLSLGKSKAFRALLDGLCEVSLELVIRLVGRQV